LSVRRRRARAPTPSDAPHFSLRESDRSNADMRDGTTIETDGGLTGGGRKAASRSWAWYPSLATALAVLYLAGPLNAGPVFNLLGASAALAVMIGARRWRPRGQSGWELIGLGLALFVAGDVVAYNYEPLVGRELPFPSVADPLYLAIYPFLVVGLMVLMRASDPTRDRAALIDCLVVTVGVGTLTWVFLMAPYVHDASLSAATKAASLAYPVMDLLLLAMSARLVLGGRRRGTSAKLLASALVALLFTDAVYGWALLHGGYETGGLLDGGWIAFYALIGTAALHPSMSRLSEPAPGPGARLTRRRLALLAATSLVAPVVQLVRSVLDLPREPVISVAAGVLFLLVLMRLAGMVRLQEVHTESILRRRFEERLAALVRHASDVVSLVDADGRVTYISPSASRLLGRPEDPIVGRRWDELVHPDDAAAIGRFLDRLATGQSAGVDHRLARADGSWLDVETLATNLLGDDTVDAVVLNTRDVSQRKELERRLAHQATHDALTSLPGRTLLLDRIDLALARRRRDGRRLAVLFVDLDDFKTLNDTMGHAAGDWALQEVAARLQSSLRGTDSAARLGGDEFALLLDGIEGPDEAIAVADRCLAALEEPLLLDGRRFAATASIGIALDSDETHTPEDMLRRADAAMYDAKRSGKSCHAVFESASPSERADRPVAH
jgi:diguanylate cyclase (GGDEF)-like protein/PAS domain S-box-containing protein